AAARKVVRVAAALARDGIGVKAVRIDSGDLAVHATRVRAILDAAGLTQVGVFASGNLDEDRLRALVAAGAPIDGYGVGTRMNTAADAPFLDCAYKLTEYDGVPRRKRSEGKANWPGRKQVLRCIGQDGLAQGDVLALQDEHVAGEPLLEQVMAAGMRIGPAPSLQACRDRLRQQLALLPPALRELDPAPSFAVQISPGLHALTRAVDDRLDASAMEPGDV
ncbi:MAG TPA: nicotinate phosphoribosyltransferase, partial [Ramlibacter sp.]|nr:nicotinate phosphoribosyltransferase [Ramlibacter sp.]